MDETKPPVDESASSEPAGIDLPEIPEGELHDGPRKWWTRQNILLLVFFALVVVAVAGFYIQRGIVQGYEHRGDRYLDQKDYNRALKYFLKAARHDPQNPRVVFSVGKTMLALGRNNEALQAFRSSFRLGGASAELYLYMGFAERRLARPDQAELFYLHALKIDRKQYAAHRELGMIRLKGGDPAGAESHLAQAQRGYSAEKDPELYETLAKTRMDLGLDEEAGETLDALLKTAPNNEKARRAREKVRRTLELQNLYRRVR